MDSFALSEVSAPIRAKMTSFAGLMSGCTMKSRAAARSRVLIARDAKRIRLEDVGRSSKRLLIGLLYTGV